MENLLRQKYKLPKSAARSIVAEAKSLLKIPPDVMFSKPMEEKCITIAEERGFLKDGQPVEKKPMRTTWFPSQSPLNANDLRNKVTEMLAHPESSLKPNNRKTDQRSSSRLKDLNTRSGKAIENWRSPNARSQLKFSKNTAADRPRKSRFVPSATLSRVLDPIVEASYSTDEESVQSVKEKLPRRRSRRNISSTSQDTTTSASTVGTSNLNVLVPMRSHIMSIIEGCEKLDVVADHARGFRSTDFDTRSFASTVSTDGESVSSSGSSLQWGLSPRRATDSPRKSISMGSTTVKSLAMRFESYEKSCEPPSSPKPVSRYLSDDESESDEESPPAPIRVLGQPPVGIVTCPRF